MSDLSKIYEKPGVNQQSDHPLGAVQSVIRGRIRFLLFGAIITGACLFGLWTVYFTDTLTGISTTPLGRLAVTAFMAGGAVYGLWMITCITCRVKLRRTGFEVSSIFGKNAYEYKDVDFSLTETVESRYQQGGFKPVFVKAQSYNFIWVCQVLFHDGRKPLLLKSSRYAWLKDKVMDLQAALKGDADT